MNTVRGTKLNMTQVFKGDEAIGVTLVKLNEGIDMAQFEEGKRVSVRAMTKGKGFQGVVKRHGFGGGPATHGNKHNLRAPGSIGSTDLGRVVPGRKMAGRMGGVNVTINNLKIIQVDVEQHMLTLRGSVPGVRGVLLEISSR
jgi:large subunit ribosomal protein L3